MKSRIDRAFGNEALLQLFQVVSVKHVSMVQSDHCMVMIRDEKVLTEQACRQTHLSL